MSSDQTAASPRERLLDAALDALEEGGPEELQARKLAARIGTSTMAVYTHFGGMPGLYGELIREGFVRFGEHLARVPRTDDPVADMAGLGLAYRQYALSHPQRYRLMFGLTEPALPVRAKQDLTTEGSPTAMPEAAATFSTLVDAVERMAEAGRIRIDFPAEDAVAVAGQAWSQVHGYVLLEMTGVFGPDHNGLTRILAPMIRHLLVGLGDDPAAVQRSLVTAIEGHPGDAA